MTREEQVSAKIKELEDKLEPLKTEQREIWKKKQDECDARIEKAERMEAKFTPDELVFAAFNRCNCGAGMAYPNNIGMRGAWYCSAILLGEADPRLDTKHTAPLPFIFYEIKSEKQPSANGDTTRKIKSNGPDS